jgi:hypothetical protein
MESKHVYALYVNVYALHPVGHARVADKRITQF